MTIAVGQRWRSRDKRDAGRVVEVVRVDSAFAWVKRARVTRLRHATLMTRYVREESR